MKEDSRLALHSEINAALDALQYLHPEPERIFTLKNISLKPLRSPAGISAAFIAGSMIAFGALVTKDRNLSLDLAFGLYGVISIAFVASMVFFVYFFFLTEPLREFNDLPLSTEKHRARVKKRLARVFDNTDGKLDPIFKASPRALQWVISSHEEEVKQLSDLLTLKFGNAKRFGIVAWFATILSAGMVFSSKLSITAGAGALFVALVSAWILFMYIFDRRTIENFQFELWFLRKELEERELKEKKRTQQRSRHVMSTCTLQSARARDRQAQFR